MQIKYKEHTPTPEEFNNLTEAVDWGTRENKIIEEALKHTLYSLCVYDENKLIGYEKSIIHTRHNGNSRISRQKNRNMHNLTRRIKKGGKLT